MLNIRTSLIILFCTALLQAQEGERDTSRAGNAKVAEIMRKFPGRGVMRDDSDPTPALKAVKNFKMRAGFEIDLVASEPAISQPLFMSWDSRGRMWVVQYRQYQFPAGLKIIRYDQHLRAVFDRVPEPPPHGPRGADRISVFEDTDGDGLYDTSKDVISGLNIATAVQVGHGGIWVLNPPYLLFYPDANGDDVPDGDPEVHLSGFGMQDTHSVANSMLWGPDGWLYGANGSTTMGTVSSAVTRGVEFQGQCIWRYHPDSRIFEIFAEGGGNTFSLDIDARGRVFSGTNGGGTRGFYYPQGSYSQKNWGKHGPLTNPYAFGFFRQMASKGDTRRFPQAFCIYDGGLFSVEFSGSIIAPNSLHNVVWHSRRIRDGSTYRTEDEENLAQSPDRWFRPVYCGVGPDGAVYVGDWYDTRLSHVSPVDDWHKDSGRIYRIRPTGTTPKYSAGDLARIDPKKLIERLDHPNKWVRRRAVLELGWRYKTSKVAALVDTLVKKVSAEGSLESLWALNLLDELGLERAVRWLNHADPDIRRWVIRLLGDRRVGHARLAQLAANEDEVQVRSQLASTAKRLGPEFAIPIVEALLSRSEDLNDPHMPLLIWWALEAQAENWPAIEGLLSKKGIWKLPLMRSAIVSRLMRRYASTGRAIDLERCAALVDLAPDEETRGLLLAGLDRAFRGRSLPTLPSSLDVVLTAYQSARGKAGIVLSLRQGKPDATDRAVKALRDRSVDLGIRLELVKVFGEIHQPKCVDTLIRLASGQGSDDPALQRVAIRSLGRYNDARIAPALIRGFGGQISTEHDLRSTACRTLALRKDWAKALLLELNEWRLKTRDIPADVVQQLRAYPDEEIAREVEKAFGKPLAISAPEKIAKLKRLTKLLSSSKGDPEAGYTQFTKSCATCHKLFGEGKDNGPPLDAYDRGNLKFWLPAIIDPSLEIREGYQPYLAVTKDGRLVTGRIAAQDPKTVTLQTAENQEIILDRGALVELKALDTSLMPENLLKELTDSQIADLFAYLSLGAR